jgi:8-oxo-dGTP diphosphatase
MSHDRSPRIHVVAAILSDARGRILLARRTDGRDLAGLWEFPGGKVEPGETPEAALSRELREELGIEVGASEPVIAVPHAYGHKRILLDVRRAASFTGRARGLESQALAWVAPEKLSSYPMPAADRPVVAALQQPDRYLITPEPGDDDEIFLRALAAALDAGVKRVQLRLKNVSPARSRSLASAAHDLICTHGAQLLLNSANPDAQVLAKELDAGLHLTASHLLAAGELPQATLVAASCHNAAELAHAESFGCHFAVLGPVHQTATHPDATNLGWETFADLRETVALPIYALGGLGNEDSAVARAHGAQGIAAIRALWPHSIIG